MKHPNAIHNLYLTTSNFTLQYEPKIRKIIELNSISLTNLPFFNIELFKQCPNINTIRFIELPPKDIPTDVDFSKIIHLEITLFSYDSVEKNKEYISTYISIIDKCTNIIALSFIYAELVIEEPTRIIFPVLMNIKTNKLRCIRGYFFNYVELDDYEPIIEKFPKLETFSVNHYKMPDLEIWTDKDNKISLFNGEVDAGLDNSNFYKLTKRYIDSNADHRISYQVRLIC